MHSFQDSQARQPPITHSLHNTKYINVSHNTLISQLTRDTTFLSKLPCQNWTRNYACLINQTFNTNWILDTVKQYTAKSWECALQDRMLITITFELTLPVDLQLLDIWDRNVKFSRPTDALKGRVNNIFMWILYHLAHAQTNVKHLLVCMHRVHVHLARLHSVMSKHLDCHINIPAFWSWFNNHFLWICV